MKQTIRILSFIPLAIITLSCVALLACLLLQEPLCQILFGISGQIISQNPAFPVGEIVFALGNLAVAVILFLNASKKTTGYWIEVICAVLVGFLLPGIRNVLGTIQSVICSNQQVDAVIAFTTVRNLCIYSLSIVHIATAISLVLCGMCIAIKHTESAPQ